MMEDGAQKTRGFDGARSTGAESPFLGLFLQRRNALDTEVLESLATVPVERRLIADGDLIVQGGPVPNKSCLLLRGAAIRKHVGVDGTGRISALCLPGDFMDLHAFVLDNLDHDTVAVGRAVVEYIDHDVLQRLIDAHPAVGRAFWRETLVDAKMHRAWVVAASALQASQRIAHLLCEMEVRLARVGLSDDGHFDSPLDQKRVAEVLGLSAVHVNRAVQELRATGLLNWAKRSIHLIDRAELRRFARFDPSYLDC
jgi:CRP-like cAMP-binding protein